VTQLVYAAAFLPADGQSLIDLTRLPEGADDLVQANIVISGDPPVGTLPEDVIRQSNVDCTDEILDWAVRRTGAQPVIPMTEPVSLNEEFERIPRTYVICSKDRIIPPPLQRRMAREREVSDVIELATDHHPQLSRTEELAAALDQRAREEVVA
jgi:pimeloyl-ACP methyl ester carboxylesterase